LAFFGGESVSGIEAFATARWADLIVLLADPVQRVALAAALVAAALVIASGLVKTIVPLRWLALAGNLGFVLYGALHPAPLVLLLHLALLPINLWRVLEMQRLVRRVRRAQAGAGQPFVWLQPYMKRKRIAPGRVLFNRGDRADRLYVLAEGELEVVENGARIGPGTMFGEISFFTPDGRRTAGVRSRTRATLLSMDEASFKQLFFQSPEFGYEVVRLVAARLSADVLRAQEASSSQFPDADEAARPRDPR
jgi:CRP/FNR family transcriptional regulator, cyclic AMP receptor protein